MAASVFMKLSYRINASIGTRAFIDLLQRSGLAQRRPVDDLECMTGMLANATLTVSAWDGAKLVAIARSLTDFHYACYLSDLAVDRHYQGQGIGKTLQAMTQQQLGPPVPPDPGGRARGRCVLPPPGLHP